MNKSRTLEQLEAHVWSSPPADGSPMVTRCLALRKVPLEQLSAGDCRVLVTQGIGTRYILPIALGHVEAYPLIECDYYPGDLLLALLRAPLDDWSRDKNGLGRLRSLAKRVDDLLTSDSEPEGQTSDQARTSERRWPLMVPDPMDCTPPSAVVRRRPL